MLIYFRKKNHMNAYIYEMHGTLNINILVITIIVLNPTGILNPISFRFRVGGGVAIENPKIPLFWPIDKPGVGCLKLG